jgi:hypothetical protein
MACLERAECSANSIVEYTAFFIHQSCRNHRDASRQHRIALLTFTFTFTFTFIIPIIQPTDGLVDG